MGKKKYNVRVRYCGGCNPEIDRGLLVKQLQARNRADGDTVTFVGHAEDGDLLLLINGCPRACLEEDDPEPAETGKRISVQGARVDLEGVPEEELSHVVWQKIKTIRSGTSQRHC
jgi:hypothetical protein